MFDWKMIQNVYSIMEHRVRLAREIVKKPLTLTEKILLSHLFNQDLGRNLIRGETYVDFSPDRVAMQDATAQMALLQFMMAGRNSTAVPSTVHCDHLVQAKTNAREDLAQAMDKNGEVYDFLESVSSKYGIGFWKPGAGIIHQVILENYAFPGGMMIGTDSHTVNAGGLGMIAIGVGGADAVDVMAGMPWELKFPKLIGVNLYGKKNKWVSAKDIILKLAGILTVKGGTGSVVEYFGEGSKKMSCTGKATICNMGAEIGATTSIFSYDQNMANYLIATGRGPVAELADMNVHLLEPDHEVRSNPEEYYDQVININLSDLEPYVNGPFTPDRATPISKMKEVSKKQGWPTKIQVGLIGSCTNSSYEDLTRSASIAKQAVDGGLKAKAQFTITPGSEQVRYTADRDGLFDIFKNLGADIFANACGPCIGQWSRHNPNEDEANTIIHSFNRNFSKRADGNPNTHAFVASPEIVTALTIAGDLTFNPLTDSVQNKDGEAIEFTPPNGEELPEKGFAVRDLGYQQPADKKNEIHIKINPSSQRLQKLKPFEAWDGENITGMKLLIKVKGKCTTDHISMAGTWLKYRGHLDNISENLLTGATNFFNDQTNLVKNQLNKKFETVPKVQRHYKAAGIPTIIVGDENYGEGSSREHAAMEPRHLGVRVVLVKSFARIHETNLKKQGMLALTFSKKSDYKKIKEDDTFGLLNLTEMEENVPLRFLIKHDDGNEEIIYCNHTYNNTQIKWFKAGSALNLIRSQN